MKITNGAVKLEASYGGFESGYGTDWGSRLRLLVIPECYQTRPEDAACRPVPCSRTGAVALWDWRTC